MTTKNEFRERVGEMLRQQVSEDSAEASTRVLRQASAVLRGKGGGGEGEGWGRPEVDWEAANEPFPVPWANTFEGDFLDAPELHDRAEHLMVTYEELHWLQEFRVRFVWKATGGAKAGKQTLGKCIKASGMAAYFAGHPDWFIWVARDHVKDHGLTHRQVEALLYHELLHCADNADDDDDAPKPGMRGHDVEMFVQEIERYGLWKSDLRLAADALQAALPGFTS